MYGWNLFQVYLKNCSFFIHVEWLKGEADI